MYANDTWCRYTDIWLHKLDRKFLYTAVVIKKSNQASNHPRIFIIIDLESIRMNILSKTAILVLMACTTSASLRAASKQVAHNARHLAMDPESYKPDKTVTSFGLITEQDIPTLQKAWGEALVSISTTYQEKGFEAAKELAQSVLDSAYCYKIGVPVLFKPTLAYGDQTFRNTEEGALAYFVGGDNNYPSHTGFALNNWTKVESYPSSVLLLGNTALSQGNVHMTNKDGAVTIVDKTWGYLKKNDGSICIMLHHSSLPYIPSSEV
jgi:hypothetical protein